MPAEEGALPGKTSHGLVFRERRHGGFFGESTQSTSPWNGVGHHACACLRAQTGDLSREVLQELAELSGLVLTGLPRRPSAKSSYLVAQLW